MSVGPEEIEAVLRSKLSPLHVEIRDETARHAGHPGAAAGGGHFQLLVVAECFIGKTAIERHRLVYDALADLLRGGIHALALRTLTPAEWERGRGTLGPNRNNRE